MVIRILCTLLGAMLVGCAFYGPEYKKPSVTTPTQWYSQDKLSHLEHTDLPMMAWWRKFDDPQLTQLIEKAVQNDDNIQIAVGNALAAKGQLEQIQFSWIPSVNAIFGYTTTNANMLVPGYNAGFMPLYSLNLFQFIRSNEWATANLAMTQAAKDAVTLTVISQTAGGYFAYLGQSYLLSQQKRLTQDLHTLLSLSQIQYKKGLISLYTLQEYEQAYEQAKAEVPILAHNVVVARNAIKLLLNENPGKINRAYSFMRLKSDHIIPTNLPSTVLKNRPDVREAEQKLIAANANVGVATATFFPSISLTGSASTASSALNNLFANGNGYWNYEDLLEVPLLAPEVYGQIHRAKGLYYAAYYNYMQTVRAAFRSVDNDLSAHDRYYASLLEEKKNYASSLKAYALARMSYKKGLYSYPTLLTNKINLDKAAIAFTRSKLAQLNTIVQLYEDLGGGYAYQKGKS